MKELIAADIGPIQPNTTIHRILDGTWSLYELIDYLIDYTGPVDAFISSFSISESAICSFQQMLEDGRMQSLRCLLDSSLRKTKTPLLFFLQNCGAEVKLTLNHSKLILLHNNNYTIAINASANMSRNRRIEAMVLDTHFNTCIYYLKTLNQLFETAIPFLP
jgi:hypothetical protein